MEVQCDHFPAAWAISYRDYYGYYPSYIGGLIPNSKTMGLGPIFVDKRLCNYFHLVLESRSGLFRKPLGSWGSSYGGEEPLVFHSSKDMGGG